MQFDFNLNPNGSQQIEVKGKFFKYKEGLGDIRVRESGGDFIDLSPGQGVWNREYSSLSVQNLSGNLNTGILIAGDFDFRDDTITGNVTVLDGAKNRTLTNSAYSCYGSYISSLNMYSHLQLYNSPVNTKTVILESIDIQCQTPSMLIGIGISKNLITIPNQVQIARSKMSSGNDESLVTVNAGQFPVAGDTSLIKSILSVIGIIQFQTTTKRLIEPVVISPGYGLVVWAGSANADLYTSFEFFEE